jgi:RNA polymerase sigma factor (sigma-70 family)
MKAVQTLNRLKNKAIKGLGSVGTLSRNEERTIRLILSKTQDFMDSPEFQKRGAMKRIYKEHPEIGQPDVSWYQPLMDDGLGSKADKAKTPRKGSSLILTAAQERVLFLKFNFARFSICKIQTTLDGRLPDLETKRELLKWNMIATQYREQIAETNLALVLAMAKRSRMTDVDFADLVGEGNMALMRSVDKFDCGRGFKFSTYACRAILKAFSRQGMKFTRYRQRFPTDFDPALEKSNYLEILREQHVADSAAEVRHVVLNNEADLSEIEQTVIHHRFGIDSKKPNPANLTLEQVGQIIGVTKERVRQIQNKALAKIRSTLEEVTPNETPAISQN